MATNHERGAGNGSERPRGQQDAKRKLDEKIIASVERRTAAITSRRVARVRIEFEGGGKLEVGSETEAEGGKSESAGDDDDGAEHRPRSPPSEVASRARRQVYHWNEMQLAIIEALRTHGPLRIAELVATTGYARRTIYRDRGQGISGLRAAGVVDHGPDGYVLVGDG